MKFNLLLSVLPFVSQYLGDQSLKEAGHKLVQLSESEAPKWLSPEEHLSLLKSGKHFMDRTYQEPSTERSSNIAPVTNFPTKVSYKTQVESIHKGLDTTRSKAFLTKLSGFFSRYYETSTARDAALYTKDYIKNIIGSKTGVTVEEFSHQWAQPSLIVRFNGTSLANEIVVLGAHIDSINQKDPTKGRSPGADDDGSGVALLTEVIASLVQSNFKPKRTLEFQFFSGEEAGLLGSQQIAQKYKKDKKNVYAMLQQDMVGYRTATKNQLRVVNDAYVNQGLTKFVKLLITSYSNNPVGEYRCGYGCSDHASYTEQSYPSACLFEAEFSPVYHSANDTIDYVDWDYFKEQAKVSVGFAVELAEPSA
jgi:leucyl aminopeptidase